MTPLSAHLATTAPVQATVAHSLGRMTIAASGPMLSRLQNHFHYPHHRQLERNYAMLTPFIAIAIAAKAAFSAKILCAAVKEAYQEGHRDGLEGKPPASTTGIVGHVLKKAITTTSSSIAHTAANKAQVAQQKLVEKYKSGDIQSCLRQIQLRSGQFMFGEKYKLPKAEKEIIKNNKDEQMFKP